MLALCLLCFWRLSWNDTDSHDPLLPHTYARYRHGTDVYTEHVLTHGCDSFETSCTSQRLFFVPICFVINNGFDSVTRSLFRHFEFKGMSQQCHENVRCHFKQKWSFFGGAEHEMMHLLLNVKPQGFWFRRNWAHVRFTIQWKHLPLYFVSIFRSIALIWKNHTKLWWKHSGRRPMCEIQDFLGGQLHTGPLWWAPKIPA